MWKNTLTPERPQMTIYYGACAFTRWTPKAKNTHAEYVTLTAFSL